MDHVTARGVVFDLDGTLVDSLGDIAASFNEVLVGAGHAAHPVEAYRGFVGDGVAALVERARPEGSDGDALLADMRRVYARRCNETTRPFPGMVALVHALRAQGRPLAVLSNKPHPMTLEVVDALFEAGTFACVLGQRDEVPRKPDPSGARECAAAMGCAAEHIALVGDTGVDIATARNAAMQAIVVGWGFRTAAELRAHAPDVLCEDVDALREALGLPPGAR